MQEKSADNNKMSFDSLNNDIVAILGRQDHRCALSLLTFDLEKCGGPRYPAIDIIDDSLPATADNIRLICNWVKNAKYGLDDLEFKKILLSLDNNSNRRITSNGDCVFDHSSPQNIILDNLYEWLLKSFWDRRLSLILTDKMLKIEIACMHTIEPFEIINNNTNIKLTMAWFMSNVSLDIVINDEYIIIDEMVDKKHQQLFKHDIIDPLSINNTTQFLNRYLVGRCDTSTAVVPGKSITHNQSSKSINPNSDWIISLTQ